MSYNFYQMMLSTKPGTNQFWHIAVEADLKEKKERCTKNREIQHRRGGNMLPFREIENYLLGQTATEIEIH